ncbi:expressed unknown protein [Seminavis robusta]|uniref:Uncharacterized protein n=1 Tax=Seminavis robusta TaxID=568900 RepID=A0A9N8D7C0_9STRA|nr:expressed unknown protein [Seminavis robusta]|eukprot:Sro27_g018100.1 n/a (1153) ;mRNA; f:38407-42019
MAEFQDDAKRLAFEPDQTDAKGVLDDEREKLVIGLSRGAGNTRYTNADNKFKQNYHRLGWVVLSLFAWVFVAMAICAATLQYVIIPRESFGRWNTEKTYSTFNNPAVDLVKITIPPIQAWVRGLDQPQGDIGRIPLLPANDDRPIDPIERHCVESFLAAGFSIDGIFASDAVMTLAQSSESKASDGIMNAAYLAFASDLSPFIDSAETLDYTLRFTGYDSNGKTCNFAVLGIQQFKFNKDYSAFPITSNVTTGLSITFDANQGKLTSIRFHIPREFLNFLFGTLLNNDHMREYVCSVMSGTCGMDQEHDNRGASCEEKIASIPVKAEVSTQHGTSQSCIILYAVLAEHNPEHCPRIATIPTEDKNGKIRCPDSLLSDSDATEGTDRSFFADWAKDFGYDPDTGYSLRCDSNNCDDCPEGTVNCPVALANSSFPITAMTTDDFSGSSGIEELAVKLQEIVPKTSPTSVEYVLQNLGLSNLPSVRALLQPYLAVPQDLIHKYNQSSTCLQSMDPMTSLAYVFLKKELSTSVDGTNKHDIGSAFVTFARKNRGVLEYFVNQAAVYDELSLAALRDTQVLNEIVDAMIHEQRLVREESIQKHFSKDEADELIKVYRATALSLRLFAKEIAENSNDSARTRHKGLIMNLLGLVRRDIERQLEDNGRVGLALASNVQFGPSNDDTSQWIVGQEFLSTHLAWSVASIWGSLPLDYLGSVLIPAVSCRAAGKESGSFLAIQSISTCLSLMHQLQPPKTAVAFIGARKFSELKDFYESQWSDNITKSRYETAAAMGESNLRHANIASPSFDRIEEMLFELCGRFCHYGSWGSTGTAVFMSSLDNDTWNLFLLFVVWITIELSGLGLELMVYVLVLLRRGWTEKEDRVFQLGQFFFPLLAVTALGLSVKGNYMALPFIVLGHWKFGFPETLLYQFVALFGEAPLFRAVAPGRFDLPQTHMYRHMRWHGQTRSNVGRVTDFLNGTGTALHHAAVAIGVAALLTGVARADRYAITPPLILAMQHWFTLLSPIHFASYVAVQILLEVAFEWVIFSELEYLAGNHWVAALSACTMVVAHWQYFLAGAIALTDRAPEDVEPHAVDPLSKSFLLSLTQDQRSAKLSESRMDEEVVAVDSRKKNDHPQKSSIQFEDGSPLWGSTDDTSV